MAKVPTLPQQLERSWPWPSPSEPASGIQCQESTFFTGEDYLRLTFVQDLGLGFGAGSTFKVDLSILSILGKIWLRPSRSRHDHRDVSRLAGAASRTSSRAVPFTSLFKLCQDPPRLVDVC